MSLASPNALAGRRVLEIADESGVYCGKLLADMGADVIKIERPGGDATRRIPPFHAGHSLFFLYMNTSKRGISLDLGRKPDREIFQRLARTADLVIETLPPGRLAKLGLGYERLAAENPGLVLTSITGFGQSGPHRDYRSSDLVASALGGALHVTGAAEDPPVSLAGSQAQLMAATTAAASSLIALFHARRSGRGQHVDISLEETTLAVSHICGVGKWLDDGIVPRRFGTGLFASVPSGTYGCRDGLVYVTVNRPAHWQALAEWIHEETGNEEVRLPIFEGPSSKRQEYRELIDLWICELTEKHRVDEIYHEGQRRHIAITPVNDAAAIARDAHLAAREYFVALEQPGLGSVRMPGAPYRHARTPWRLARPAPAAGEHNREIFVGELGLAEASAASGGAAATSPSAEPGVAEALEQALDGLRVVEFTAGMAGPWIGRFMAWCGAEVVKIESRTRPGVVRLYVPPRQPERGIQPRLSPWFTDWDAGKRFVALDLSKPEAVDLARRLVARADVVVENYATGVLEKLGLGYDELVKGRPDLIYIATTGYGDSGPCCRYVTWGPNIEAMAGLARLSGFPERECTITQYAYPDALSALHGLFAVMCALDHRERTGEGQRINLSQLEATIGVIGPLVMEQLVCGREPGRLGNGSRHAAPHGCYPCRGSDRWCAISVFDEEQWSSFCDVLDRPDWAADPRFTSLAARLEHAAALDAEIGARTRARDAYDWMHALQAAGVAAGVVQTTEDQLHHDPQLAARGFFERIPHLAKGEVIAAGIPLGLTATPGSSRRAGAAIGEDNDAVFREWLGLADEELARYSAIGAIEEPMG